MPACPGDPRSRHPRILSYRGFSQHRDFMLPVVLRRAAGKRMSRLSGNCPNWDNFRRCEAGPDGGPVPPEWPVRVSGAWPITTGLGSNRYRPTRPGSSRAFLVVCRRPGGLVCTGANRSPGRDGVDFPCFGKILTGTTAQVRDRRPSASARIRMMPTSRRPVLETVDAGLRVPGEQTVSDRMVELPGVFPGPLRGRAAATIAITSPPWRQPCPGRRPRPPASWLAPTFLGDPGHRPCPECPSPRRRRRQKCHLRRPDCCKPSLDNPGTASTHHFTDHRRGIRPLRSYRRAPTPGGSDRTAGADARDS